MNPKLAQRYHDDGMAVTPRPQLVGKLYERLQSDLAGASAAARAGEIEGAHDALVHAQEIVLELSLALDLDLWDGARGLRAIYDHLDARMVEANLRKSPEIVDECLALVEPLVDAWQQALAITQQVRVPDTATSPERRLNGVVTA